MRGISTRAVRNAMTSALAGELEALYAEGYAEYVEACDQDRLRGHRPHYCEHGTNQWVDYDNICGGCEEGYSMGDVVQRAESAAHEAASRVELAEELHRSVTRLYDAGVLGKAEAKACKLYAHSLTDARTYVR